MDIHTKHVISPKPYIQRTNNLIAVVSGKGGIGKTWFSSTLAHALSSMKQKVLFFDVDGTLLTPKKRIVEPILNKLHIICYFLNHDYI